MTHSLLPPNATGLERAVETATARIGDVAVPVDVLLDPARIPVEWLPWLAWGLSVDNWNADWSEQEKRDAVARSIALHRIKGTRASVESVLAGHDDQLHVVEWHEAAPRLDPNRFEVRLPLDGKGGDRATAAFATAVARDVTRIKPVREHFQLVQSVAATAGAAMVGAAATAGIARVDTAAVHDPDPVWGRLLQTEDGEPLQEDAGFLEHQ